MEKIIELYSRRFLLTGAILFLISIIGISGLNAAEMPEFTTQASEHWINSDPMKVSDLKGKIVLIEVWTSI
ncbi:MAG: hypothetical protein GY786_01920 [Proteobacteria bacterium]|nr:hypothetical protein [Pseudomonadota bacterium]